MTFDHVLDAAVVVAIEHGAEGLTPTRVALHLGIKTPSLYHHISGSEGLRAAVAVEGWRRMVDSMPALGEDLPDTLRRLARAYRAWALEHPKLYQLMTDTPFDPTDARLFEVTASALSALHQLGLEGEAAIHALRGLRSALHGFVDVEVAGQFRLGVSPAESFDWLVETLIRGVLTSS